MRQKRIAASNTSYIYSLVKEFIGNMQQEISLNDLKMVDEHGVEYWSARNLMPHLGYVQWRNFSGVIKRAISLIIHKHLNGWIIETIISVEIGSGAQREISDYLMDREGVSLLSELCSSFKLNNFYSIRNETVVLQLVEKYCQKKDIDFQYQYRIGKFLFDCKVGNNILIEFDEPHHQYSARQREIDNKKNTVAKAEGFSVYRVNVEMDIIDIIVYLESN